MNKNMNEAIFDTYLEMAFEENMRKEAEEAPSKEELDKLFPYSKEVQKKAPAGNQRKQIQKTSVSRISEARSYNCSGMLLRTRRRNAHKSGCESGSEGNDLGMVRQVYNP